MHCTRGKVVANSCCETLKLIVDGGATGEDLGKYHCFQFAFQHCSLVDIFSLQMMHHFLQLQTVTKAKSTKAFTGKHQIFPNPINKPLLH